MRKIILLLVLLLSFVLSYAFDVNYKQEFIQYWGENNLQQVDNILTSWNKKVLQKENPLSTYNKVLEKIEKSLDKNLNDKVKILLLYIKAVIEKFTIYFEKENQKSENNKQTGNDLSEKNPATGNNNDLQDLIRNYRLDYSTLKRNEILVPISGTLYGVLGFYIKSLYGNSLVYSLVFQNVYGAEADYNIKNLYLFSSTGLVLSKTKLVNGIAYFDLPKPANLLKGWNTTFYILAELNPINSLNQTNKKLKLKLIKAYNTYKTKVISKENGNEAYWLNTEFNANTYIFRKSKPILENKYFYGRLYKGQNKIYSLDISATGGEVSLRKMILDVNTSTSILLDTGSVEIYLNNTRKDNIKAYLDKQRGNAKLYIDFNNYDILEKIKLDVYVNVLKTRDNASIYTKLDQISSDISAVYGNYTGDYSLLYSDKAYKSLLNDSVKDYFTESYLNFDKVTGWYLKDR